ncbi:hypothetical protein BD410DRAFT_787483 [Rickenella mellea]|uniref:Uncharacterized protein n=1 Tax=Rickenella mellea TaxID=50990 RepID=A0A4Y7Q7S0_9AGAM|nr:hypothetical protein BD410DRAFT_787483 [Rickenella mellea]
MTPRPSLASSKPRPSSAIFIGSVPNQSSPQLPDLPEPPDSPTTSSGLPSPPATNSTGSGSTGDASTNIGSVRRPLSSHTLNMQNGDGSSSSSSQSKTKGSSEDEGADENEEDHTAKLSDDRRRLLSSPRVSENASTLLRVKSLTQRNRAVLDKLTSISSGSRLSTPSPSRHVRSPAPPSSASASSSTSSSRLAPSSVRLPRPASSSGMSGSETEREPISATGYESDDQSVTPQSTFTAPSPPRLRRISAPASPARHLALARVSEDGRDTSPPPTAARRKRVTMTEGVGAADIAAAALEAVANSRQSPTNMTGRRRQPLPREFRDEHGGVENFADEPSTPHRTLSPGVHVGRSSPSPRSHTSALNESPTSPRLKRFSTVREMTRRHQTRWLSQDLASNPDDGDSIQDVERRQTRRAGSTESPFGPGGRSVVSESLRAAGLARRRDSNDDVFNGETGLQVARRIRLSGGLGTRPSIADNYRDDHGGSSIHSGSLSLEPRTPANASQSTQRLLNRNTQSVMSSRPSTSMAAYNEEPRTAPPQLRSQRSAFPISERDRQALVPYDSSSRPSSQAQNALPDRTYASPSTVGRRSTMTPFSLNSSTSTSEHTRLMLESLGMFESQLARLPSMGTTTTLTVPELFRSAQNIVHSANTLNTLLRTGTSHALEEQIEAEVGDAQDQMDPADIWRNVGGEYRESLRVSDELVRTMTSFLLGIGKLLRDTTNGTSQHARGSSLDENAARRGSPDVIPPRDGRTSAEGTRVSNGSGGGLRRSWQPPPRDRDREEDREGVGRRAPSRTEAFSGRPQSSLDRARDRDLRRDSDAASSAQRNASRPSCPSRGSREKELPLAPTPNVTPSPSIETFREHDYEPSPTPAVRNQGIERRRTVQTVSVPPPLQTLPSESLLQRSISASTSGKSVRHSKVSTASNATVRATSIFPSIATSNPTTAVTQASASASPEKRPFPLRADTTGSVSRASGRALAGLQKQYERDGRKRTISSTSNMEENLVVASPITRSGSETERPPESSRRTINRVRVSLDGPGPSNIPSRSPPTEKKDRRRTVTDIFSRG